MGNSFLAAEPGPYVYNQDPFRRTECSCRILKRLVEFAYVNTDTHTHASNRFGLRTQRMSTSLDAVGTFVTSVTALKV